MRTHEMSSIPLGDLLQCVVECGQKAARIAQIFRAQDDLFGLLVEEKSLLARNDQLVQDYKTLADVLVQETIRRDVGQQFPSLLSNIKGEEQNSFKNSLGQSIHVELTASEEDTASLLRKVLDGRDHVAESLAAVVHSKATTCKRQLSSRTRIPADSIGIWIDPIDSTAEYIQGKSDESDEHGFQPLGLKCVCVLIGVYDLESGKPIIGVVNQPFFHKENSGSSWECRFYWAVNYNTDRFTSPSLRAEAPPAGKTSEKPTIVISYSENKRLQAILATKYKLVHTAGAGYKALLVASHKARLWVISQGNNYFWDTCGPHALLAATGGGMVRFDTTKDIADIGDLGKKQMVYTASDGEGVQAFRNVGGVVAYTREEDVMELVQLLKDSGYWGE